MQFNLSKNLLIGQGQTSIQTAYYLQKKGYPFQIYSLKPNQLPSDLKVYYTRFIPEYTMAWLSPGISERDPCLKGIDLEKAWLDIDYFLSEYRGPVILVTGSTGKSTVCQLLKTMLLSLGYDAEVYGNYQPGVLQLLSDPKDWVILELSSFQLEKMRFEGKVAASVLLNISRNHIDWHGSYEAYHEAKCKILEYSDINIGLYGKPFSHRVSEWMDRGVDPQMALNLAASAETLSQLGLKVPMLSEVPRLPYRQTLHQLGDRIIINDSKSSTLASVLSAIEVCKTQYPNKRILLVMAGSEKDHVFEPLLKYIESLDMIVIGSGFQGLSPYFSKRYRCIEEAMSCIMEYRGIVLFSPGGTSYDQYGSYEERGKDFDRCLFEAWTG